MSFALVNNSGFANNLTASHSGGVHSVFIYIYNIVTSTYFARVSHLGQATGYRSSDILGVHTVYIFVRISRLRRLSLLWVIVAMPTMTPLVPMESVLFIYLWGYRDFGAVRIYTWKRKSIFRYGKCNIQWCPSCYITYRISRLRQLSLRSTTLAVVLYLYIAVASLVSVPFLSEIWSYNKYSANEI